jgi:putative hydrolase of the HAD superfamily
VINRNLLQNVRAVMFDAVGTLIVPHQSVPLTYHDAAKQRGSRLTADEIARRFRGAFRAQEELDRQAGWVTDDSREYERWRTIVHQVLDDVNDVEECFQNLHAHFEKPAAWRVQDSATALIRAMKDRGKIVGLASNFDSRLRSVIAGLPELADLDPIVVSSEAGSRKPGRPFFAGVVAAACVQPSEILFIGDDLENDHQGALASGLQSILLGPHKGAIPDLPALLDALGLRE